jgi:hypothetical protein
VPPLLDNAEVVVKIMESRREHSKLRYDWYKQQTTLSTATALIFLALLGAIFQSPSCEWLVLWSAGFLFFSTALSFTSMWLTNEAMASEDFMFMTLAEHQNEDEYRRMDRRMENFQKAAKLVGVPSTGVFLLGVFFFVWFVIQNLG